MSGKRTYDEMNHTTGLSGGRGGPPRQTQPMPPQPHFFPQPQRPLEPFLRVLHDEVLAAYNLHADPYNQFCDDKGVFGPAESFDCHSRFAELVDSFQRFPRRPATSIELEVRMALVPIGDTGFHASFSQQDFVYLLDIFTRKMSGLERKVSQESEYVADISKPGRRSETLRWSLNQTSIENINIKERERPVAFKVESVGSNMVTFRINRSKETRTDKLQPHISGHSKHDKMRHKERVQFSSERSRVSVFFTKVTSITNGTGAREVTYEIEIEVLFDRVGGPGEIPLVADEIYKVINVITTMLKDRQRMPENTLVNSEFFGVQAVELPRQDSKWVSSMQQINQCFGYKELRRFPGILPVTFMRCHFETLVREEYFVAEKTDGKRVFLYIDRDGAYFLNRKLSLFKVDGGKAFSDALHGIALFDGELVERFVEGGAHVKKETVFLVFDVILLNDEHHLKSPFVQRMLRYTEAVAAMQAVHSPFRILAKPFVTIESLDLVFAKVHEEKGDRFFDNGDGSVHKTDGLVFVHSGPYKSDGPSGAKMLKWKYPELNTIDFRLVPSLIELGKFDLYVEASEIPDSNGDRFEEIQYSTFLTAEDAAVVQEEMRKSEVNPGKSPAGLPIDVQDRPFPEMIKRCFFSSERRELRVNPIFEMAYDSRRSQWRVKAFRPEKSSPNHMTVAAGTLMTAMENVTDDELIRRLVLKEEEPDFWISKEQKEKDASNQSRQAASARR